MVPVVAFVGHHNSGKTTIASKVVKELKKRGYSVAVLKSSRYNGVVKDTQGKDSFKYREVGADAVGIVSPEELVLFQNIDGREVDLKLLSFLLFDDYDIVVCEGFKSADVPKIEVTRKDLNQPLLFGEVERIVAVVSDYQVEGVKSFSFNEVEALTSFIEDTFIKKRENQFPDEVELFVNGKRVPIKHYVKETLREILLGFVKPLKEIEFPVSRMDIRIVIGRGKRS